MAQNYIQPGEAVTVVAAVAMTAGTPYLLGAGKLVVALGSAAIGKEVECGTTGVYEVPKTAPLAIAQGALVYWNDTTKKITVTNTDTPAGWAFKAAGSAATTVQIKLAP